ncbi:hypothetical protein D3C73_1146940 [compost metagenome]
MGQLECFRFGYRSILKILDQPPVHGVDLVPKVHTVLQHEPELIRRIQLITDPEQYAFGILPLTALQLIFQGSACFRALQH